MKKSKIALLLFVLLSLVVASCSKKESEFQVYGPPSQKINFSDVSDLIIDSTGKTIAVKAKVASENGLQKVEVIYQPWNLAVSITSFTNPNNFDLNVPVSIPSNAGLKLHSIVIKATDKAGGTNFTEVKVGLQDLNYSKLYMADVADNAGLTSDLFGVPVLMNKTGAHTYELVYYARTPNTRVRFIPNKTSLTPVAIGLDPSNSQKLITDALKSLPLILAQRGYYKITINTLLLSQKVESITVTGNPFNEVALVGRGFYDYPNMNWQNALPDIILLDKDPSNPFLFTKQVRLGTPPGQTYGSAQFIFTTNNGWTNFWQFDNGSSPEITIFNGGTNTDLPITSTPTNYLFVFDTYTGRVQVIKQ